MTLSTGDVEGLKHMGAAPEVLHLEPDLVPYPAEVAANGRAMRVSGTIPL